MFLPCLQLLSKYILNPSAYYNMILTLSGALICSFILTTWPSTNWKSMLRIHARIQISALRLPALRFGVSATKLRFSFVPVPDFFEDGLPLPAQAYLKVCSAVSEASLNDVKPSSPPAILGSPPREAVLPSSGTTVQRRSVLHTEEIVRVSLISPV